MSEDQPNTFTENQKAMIEKVAWDVGDKIAERLCAKVDERIDLHAAKCPAVQSRKAIKIMVGILMAALIIVNLWLGLARLSTQVRANTQKTPANIRGTK